MKKSLSLIAIFGLLLSLGLVSLVSANAPVINDLPDVKLTLGHGLTPAFDLVDYDITTSGSNVDPVNSAAIITNFLNASSISSTLSGSTVTSAAVNYGTYGSATSGANTYQLGNAGGNTNAGNKVKWSSYIIKKIRNLVLRPGDAARTVSLSAIDTAGSTVNPPSFGNPNAIVVSDTTQISAAWDSTSTKVVVTALAGFNAAQSVDVIASPVASGAIGLDQDKERINVYPAINSTAFDFTSAGDTALFAYQTPAGVSTLPSVTQVASINDGAGAASRGGALSVTFSSSSDGVKITPSQSAWVTAANGTYYTLRVRAMASNLNSSYLQVMFNGVAATTPTDIQGYFRFTTPTTWTEMDIPMESASAVSTGSWMYPQLILKASGGTGTVYVDDIRLFAGTPAVIGTQGGSSSPATRYRTSTKLGGGSWDDASATTKWNVQLTGSPSVSYNNGQIQFTGSGASQEVAKFTSSTAAGTVVTVSPVAGKEAGMHMYTALNTGTPSLTLNQVQINMLGASASGSLVQAFDIAAAAEVGRVSTRTLRLAFVPLASDYQVQFVLKGSSAASYVIDNTQADIENDDPNYGDIILFP